MGCRPRPPPRLRRTGDRPTRAPIGNRTLDLFLTMETLCRLSYWGTADVGEPVTGTPQVDLLCDGETTRSAARIRNRRPPAGCPRRERHRSSPGPSSRVSSWASSACCAAASSCSRRSRMPPASSSSPVTFSSRALAVASRRSRSAMPSVTSSWRAVRTATWRSAARSSARAVSSADWSRARSAVRRLRRRSSRSTASPPPAGQDRERRSRRGRRGDPSSSGSRRGRRRRRRRPSRNRSS